MVTEYKKDLLKIFTGLDKEIVKFRQMPLKDFENNLFKACVISSISKCYQFNLDINSVEDNANSFYYSSFLRGVCEDLISLKYLLTIEESKREGILSNYLTYLLNTSIKSQGVFFKKVRPFQPVVSFDNIDDEISGLTKNLNNIWQSLGHKKDKLFPSVQQMAIDSKLIALYDFLYHATSRTVHFSPNVLFRTGWFMQNDEDAMIDFNVNNFSTYYGLFNSHYAAILFIEYIDAFKKYLNLPRAFLKTSKAIRAAQEKLTFFPEIITFEELNLRRPNDFEYRTLELTHAMPYDERKEFLKAIIEILAGKKTKKKSKKGEK